MDSIERLTFNMGAHLIFRTKVSRTKYTYFSASIATSISSKVIEMSVCLKSNFRSQAFCTFTCK